MTEIERLHPENDAVILRASNYLLRDQLQRDARKIQWRCKTPSSIK